MFKEKNSRKVVMLLAGLIILLHAIIPHHHHFDSPEDHPENVECETTNSDRNNENPDTHCHAFNLVISNSVSYLNVHSIPVSKSNLHLFCINTNIELASKHNLANYAHCFLFFPQKQIFLTNHSLRAPPKTV